MRIICPQVTVTMAHLKAEPLTLAAKRRGSRSRRVLPIEEEYRSIVFIRQAKSNVLDTHILQQWH